MMELVIDKTKIVIYKSQSNVGGVITPVFRLSVNNELKQEVFSPDEIKLKIQELVNVILFPTMLGISKTEMSFDRHAK